MTWSQDHYHLRCRDYEGVIRFFVEHLEAKEEGRLASGTVNLRIGGALYKVSPKKPADSSAMEIAHHEIYHLGFETDDLADAVAKMRARGVKVAQDQVHNTSQRPYAFVEGPEGIWIELLQRGK